jgi:hypothetical protein
MIAVKGAVNFVTPTKPVNPFFEEILGCPVNSFTGFALVEKWTED